MNVDFVTKQDLEQFKKDLFEEMKKLFETNPKEKKWLKSYQVRDLLGISRGTLQNMRINGTLKATKVGGLMYYDYADILKMLKGNRL
jgi:hypothetical protein